MTLLTLAIAILLVLAINSHQTGTTHSTASSSADSSVMAHSSSVSEQTAYEQFRDQLESYNDHGITVAQKQKLQSLINHENNSAVQSREQKLLDRTTVKSTSSASDSSAASSSSAKKESQNPTSFATTHTFSSVNDAQNWAQASKNQWLQAGYSTYTITSDGQGNYNLQFVR